MATNVSLFRCFFLFFFFFSSFFLELLLSRAGVKFIQEKQKESMGLGLVTKLKGITVISSLTFVHFGVR